MDKPVSPKKKKKSLKTDATKAAPKKAQMAGILFIVLMIAVLINGFLYLMRQATTLPSTAIDQPAAQEYQFDPSDYNFNATYPQYHLPPDAPVIHILFIGDSYTLVNNMPYMLAAVAASDTANPTDIKPEIAGQAGASLGDLWALGTERSKVHSRSST